MSHNLVVAILLQLDERMGAIVRTELLLVEHLWKDVVFS
jgi:hypothetical protein